MPRILRKPRAQRDLIEVWQYIAAGSGLDRADAFSDRIEQKLDLLAENPMLGRPRTELKQGLRSFPVGRYLVLYFPLDDGIDVVRVLYGGRNLDTIFRNEEAEPGDE